MIVSTECGPVNSDNVALFRRNGVCIEAVIKVSGRTVRITSPVKISDIVQWSDGFIHLSTTSIVASDALIMYHKGGWVSVRGCRERIRVTKKFEATVSKHDPMDDAHDYRMGFKAKIGGWSKAVCPFKKSKPGYANWCEGWDDGPSAPWNK